MPADKTLHDALDGVADKKAARDAAAKTATDLDNAAAKARQDAADGHSAAGKATEDLVAAENAFLDSVKAFVGDAAPAPATTGSAPAPATTGSTAAA